MHAMHKIIEQRIREALHVDAITVCDDSHKHVGHVGNPGGGGHYCVTVVSSDFEGLTRVQRHQKIYALFLKDIPQRIHALSLILKTPTERIDEERV